MRRGSDGLGKPVALPTLTDGQLSAQAGDSATATETM